MVRGEGGVGQCFRIRVIYCHKFKSNMGSKDEEGSKFYVNTYFIILEWAQTFSPQGAPARGILVYQWDKALTSPSFGFVVLNLTPLPLSLHV